MEDSIQDLPFLQQNKRKAKKTGQEKINFTLQHVHPLTSNQRATFREYSTNKHLMLHGLPGTGKTFLLLYLALNQLLNENSPYKKIVLIRSVVPTRNIGFLPGKVQDKAKVYEAPYYAIVGKLFGRGDAYDYLKNKGYIEFMTTSFIRGLTIDDSLIIVDEMQNASFHELDSCVTRVGENSKILFAGDFRQTDFIGSERDGLREFMNIIRKMGSFGFVEFYENDIVRSGLVKEYIITREKLNIAV